MDSFINVKWQDGNVPDNGVNGATVEEVIEVAKLRIALLNSKFPCRENSLAITKLEEATHWLEARTKERTKRGVEGKETA